jgi:hypothetical protein
VRTAILCVSDPGSSNPDPDPGLNENPDRDPDREQGSLQQKSEKFTVREIVLF